MPRSAKVLVVDDSDDYRHSVVDMLFNLGISVDSLSDGREALALFDQHRPYDIVVADVGMRYIGGIELKMRLARQHPDVTVILMTDRMSAANHAVDFGAVALIKPFTAEQLWRVVEEVVKNQRKRAN